MLGTQIMCFRIKCLLEEGLNNVTWAICPESTVSHLEALLTLGNTFDSKMKHSVIAG